MKLALIGKPKSGKTTIFNALTNSELNTDKYAPPAKDANIGIVNVLDERITKLSELYKPKKTIYANIEFHDFPGIFSGEGGKEENAFYADILSCEAFALVLKAFSDAELESLYRDEGPIKTLKSFEEEMIVYDMILCEKRLEKIHLGFKRGVKTPEVLLEEKTVSRIMEHLQENRPIRSIDLESDELKAIRGLQFFSQKPLLVLLNTGESEYSQMDGLVKELKQEGYLAEKIAGKFEAELSALDEEEAELFMQDMGIEASIKDRISLLSYQLMGLISFFTVGQDEVRAWTITKGTNAVNAAGKIHSDLARGFIRAECFSYEQIMQYGSEKHLREKGLFRLEGKEYIVQDGDILSIRFNV